MGSCPTENKAFGAQSHSGRDSQSLPFFLATFLDYTSSRDFGVPVWQVLKEPYTCAASLDTEPGASSYSGEIHTHSSSTISSSILASFCSTVVWAGCQAARDLNVIIAFAPALCKLFLGGELVQSSDVASAPVAFCLHLPKNSTCKRSLQRSSNTKEICPARKSGSLLSCGSVGLARGLLNDLPTPPKCRANRPLRLSLHRPLRNISQDSPSPTIRGSQFSLPVRWNA